MMQVKAWCASLNELTGQTSPFTLTSQQVSSKVPGNASKRFREENSAAFLVSLNMSHECLGDYFCSYVACDFFILATLPNSYHLKRFQENSKYRLLKVDVT